MGEGVYIFDVGLDNVNKIQHSSTYLEQESVQTAWIHQAHRSKVRRSQGSIVQWVYFKNVFEHGGV
jgi:hypothetical protein